MASKPTFGISFEREDSELRPAIPASMSVVGIVGIAEGADATAFPVNEPRIVYTSDAASIGKLGPANDNSLTPALNGIAAQLGAFQRSAITIVVRVQKGADVWATIANLCGSATQKTGVHALRLAGPRLGTMPRLVIVPGYTSQQRTGISSIAVTVPGAGYTAAPAVTIAAPPAGGVQATGTAVLTGGSVTSVTITNPGAGYTGTPAVTIAAAPNGGTNAQASATIAPLANPVCAALPAALEAMLAHAVVAGPGTSEEADLNWRETLNSQRIIPVASHVIVTQADGTSAVVPGVPHIVGIGVRRDFEKGGRPFHSWANQPVQGIEGPSRPIEFSITDGDVEGQRMLANNLGVIVRGESGVDDAIADGGFVFIGTDNAGDDELWRFYNVTRGRDYIHLLFLRTLRFYLGKFNLTGHTVQAVINTMTSALEGLKADGDILGYTIGFTPDKNTPEEIRKGWFYITFRAEEAPVLRGIGIRSGRYRVAVEGLISDLLQQFSLVA